MSERLPTEDFMPDSADDIWAPVPPSLDAEGPAPVDLRHVRDHKFDKGNRKKGCAHVGPDGFTCGAAKTAMVHVGTPQSLNFTAGRAAQFTYQAMLKAWKERLAQLLEESGLPRPLEHVLAEGQCCFPDRIRRDQGNHRFILEKALGDALVDGGWLEDDDWTRYEFGRLHHAYEKGESWTALTVFPRVAARP